MLELSLTQLDWMDKAECIGADTKLFFPDHKLAKGAKEGANSYKRARAYCNDCEVQPQCLHYAMKMFPDCNDDYGMWGGMSPRERRLYKRKSRLAAKAERING